MFFTLLEKPPEQIPSTDGNTILSLVDTRQTNREKVIAESYWQDIFDGEKQNKTYVV